MIIVKRYLIVLMLFFIAACSSEDTIAPQQSTTTPAVTQKTPKNSIQISPDNATAQSVITLRADTLLLANATIDWYINGNIAESSGKRHFSSSAFKKGNIIQAIITKNKKEYYSNEIRITNTPPRIRRAEMVPALPRVGANITININAHDVDGDTIYYRYKWTLNGKYVSDANYLNLEFKRDDMIVVEITPYDSDNNGSNIFVKNKIFNSSPLLTGNKPSFDGKTYTYHLNVTDIDGDDITYKMLECPDGMSVSTSGVITWELRPEDAGRHEFTVLINDNNGGELIVPIIATIGF